jgi:hypothetical protein
MQASYGPGVGAWLWRDEEVVRIPTRSRAGKSKNNRRNCLLTPRSESLVLPAFSRVNEPGLLRLAAAGPPQIVVAP